MSKMPDINQDKKCLFCNIESTSTELMYQDDEYLAFKDIKPAAQHHYLIIPKNHIKGISNLEKKDLMLLRRLVEIGEMVLQKNGAEVSDARFGFHVPPFTSISHLHLHAISPVSQMGFFGRIIFRADSYWFTTASTLIERLEKLEAESTQEQPSHTESTEI